MPQSDGPWRTQVDNSPQLCGLLYPYITHGPFLDCWRALDAKVNSLNIYIIFKFLKLFITKEIKFQIFPIQARSAYHASCRYDVYLYSHDEGTAAHSAACRSLEAVAQVCAGLGHHVVWRYAAKCCEWSFTLWFF